MTTSETQNTDLIQNWTPLEVHTAFEKNEIVIIDVRTPQEYMFEHIEGVLLTPMAFFKPENLPSQINKPILLHCGSGVRSEKVAKICLEAGIESIAHMVGGFSEWKKSGFAYIGTDMNTGSPARMKNQV